MLSDNIKGIEDDFCVVSGQWMHGPEEDPFPEIIVRYLGPDDRDKKNWAKCSFADHDHISEVLKFLGGLDRFPFARSAPILFDYIPLYRSFVSPPQGFTISEATNKLHKWFSWSEEEKWEFYHLHQPTWRPAPTATIFLEEPIVPSGLISTVASFILPNQQPAHIEGEAGEPVETEYAEQSMAPKLDLLRAAQENIRKRREEGAR